MPDLPQALDRFEILRILGKGGMGSVYLARDQRLGRQVALKVLNSEDLASADRRARFLREAKTAAAIRHQNVATIYEVGETDEGQPFIVMEYCEGETLAQRLRRRQLDAHEFLVIARQIAAGLAAAHDNGVIHRDIKTANIMIEPTGLVKILDFGLAKLLPREGVARSFESTSGHFFGTLHYLSPEQTRGETSDERSDLFSTGVVMYQMASGHLPFNSDVALMVLDRIRDTEPEPFTPLDPAFPAAGARVIGRLLQKKPADRYQDAHELLADLDAIDTPTVRVSTHHTRSMIGRTIARPRWLQISIVIALLIAGAAVLIVVRNHNASAKNVETTTAATAPAGPVRSIAVLPLDNLAGNQKDDFLSVSLADALVTKLQVIPSLQVRPTSAVVQYHNKKIDAPTAGKQLQVDGVLEGHFLAAGDLVRVNLQLTDARSGYSIWADSINGKRANLLQLIDDVSSRTLSALNDKLGVQNTGTQSSQPRSSNPKAYEEYLRARALNGSLLPADVTQQIAALKHAIELDPNFAAAYADLSLALSLGTARGLVNDPQALQKSEWYARQAVRLDANLAEAHLALGRIFVRSPDRFREATRENLAAVRLNPSDSQSLWTIASYFVSIGDTQKAQCISDRLVRLDPQSNESKTRGYWYVNAVDPEGALRSADIALASKDTELAGHDIRGIANIVTGNLDAAQHDADAASALSPKHYIGKSLHAMIAAARGDRIACEGFVKTFEDEANRNHWAAIRIAMCYAKLGDRDQALKWVNKSVELGHHSWYELVKHPWFQGLQSDPDFQTVLAKIKTDLDDVRDDVVGVYQLLCK